MPDLMSDYSRQIIKDAILRNIAQYGRSVLSVGAARMTFEFRPMEAKLIDGKFTIVPELNELDDFCTAHNLKYELDHERWVLSFRKDKTITNKNLL